MTMTTVGFTLYTRLLELSASLLAGGLSWVSPARPLVLQAPPVPNGMKDDPYSHREADFLLASGLDRPRVQCRGPCPAPKYSTLENLMVSSTL